MLLKITDYISMFLLFANLDLILSMIVDTFAVVSKCSAVKSSIDRIGVVL